MKLSKNLKSIFAILLAQAAVVSVMLPALAIAAPAAPVLPDYQMPADRDVIVHAGGASVAPANRLRLLVWNIHKSTAGVRWEHDFKQLVGESDVALFQEGHLIPALKQAIMNNRGFQWFFAVAFFFRGAETGVLSATRWPTEGANWFRSPDREPILHTPKMSLGLRLPLPDGRKLLILNTHGINFVRTGAFERQIDPLVQALREHQGPAIFAGDFNTWNRDRLGYLITNLLDVGMLRIPLINDTRRLQLDHVFQRGLTIETAHIRTEIGSSDHWPIQAVFSTINPLRRAPLR